MTKYRHDASHEMGRRRWTGTPALGAGLWALLLASLLGTQVSIVPNPMAAGAWPSEAPAPEPAVRCGAAAEPPVYYAFPLRPTRSDARLGRVTGTATLTWHASPFDVHLSRDGHFVYDLVVEIEGLRPRGNQVGFALWVAPPDLKQVELVGLLDEHGRTTGIVHFNKFLVFLTEEPDASSVGERWSGPILLKGMSRSARMQSMAGHGFFEQEPC